VIFTGVRVVQASALAVVSAVAVSAVDESLDDPQLDIPAMPSAPPKRTARIRFELIKYFPLVIVI
jgi:hypothetical protein